MTWNRFDDDREFLEHQYDGMRRDASVAEAVGKLTEECVAMVDVNGQQSPLANRAAVFRHILETAPIEVQPQDMFADHIAVGNLPWRLSSLRARHFPPTHDAAQMARIAAFAEKGIFHAMLDLSHTSPDWQRLIVLGPSGLKAAAESRLSAAADAAQREFYSAVAEVYSAVIELLERFAAEADRQGLDDMAECLRNIAARPPKTLREALQWALIYDTCQEIEGEYVRSQGPFDRLFIDYYRHDLENGLLDREQAKELIKYFWTKFYAQGFIWGKNIGFGGCDASGNDVCNELTELGFEIHRELGRINPKLSFRVHPNTPDERLMQVAECVRDGKTSIVFSNDVTVMESMRRHGKSAADASDYVLIGCYEPAVLGREMCCSMSAWGNLVPPFEAALNDGCTFGGVRIGPSQPLPGNARELKDAYIRQLSAMMATVLEQTRAFERTWPDVNPSPLLSGTMQPCMDSGRDVSAGGTAYNSSGVMCGGFGTVVDALLGAAFLVDERKACSMGELRDILKANWAGHGHLRELVQARALKWGNGLPEADSLAREIFARLSSFINAERNARGGWFQLGLWSIDHNIGLGKLTPATADGRLAGEPLSRNMGGSVGMEKHGATALVKSVCGLDLASCGDGAVLDVMLHPSALAGEGGGAVVANLVRAYCQEGGAMIHFNILNPEALKDARVHPEKYGELQVRVCGWNSRFVDLSGDEQEFFIRQAEAAQ